MLILTPSGYCPITQIAVGDVSEHERMIKVKITSPLSSRWKMKRITHARSRPDTMVPSLTPIYPRVMPLKVSMGNSNPPAALNCHQQTRSQLQQIGIEYHHLAGENRRTNNLIANGVIVESFSTELL